MVSGFNQKAPGKGTTTYSDIDLSFLPNPATGDLRKKTDIDAIKQAIKILLFTNSGERPLRPNLAGNLNNLLFEPLDTVTTILLQREIITTIQAFEPRVSVLSVDVNVGSDNKSINITIAFRVLNQPNIEQIQVFVERKR